MVEVGEGADEFRVGQRVACAGDQYAHHAEFNWVPTNLCVAVPEGVAPEAAAFATVGSIALHGFRRSGAVLGETAVVIGLGLVGQLLVQILRSAGVRVIGVDVSAERCDLAVKMGATAAAAPGSAEFEPVREALADLTDGAGADHVFLTAGTTERDPVLLAAELAATGPPWSTSARPTSICPGTATTTRSSKSGCPAPMGRGGTTPVTRSRGGRLPHRVRPLDRAAQPGRLPRPGCRGEVDLVPLISEVFDFDQAVEVYDRLHDGSLGGIGNVFRYQAPDLPQREVRNPVGTTKRSAVAAGDLVRLGVIGCGNYASTMLLPHLTGRDDVELATVVTRSALSAATAARKFGFSTTATDLDGLLADERIPAVLIATRHESHAALVVRALEAGKAVLVEKPLAVDRPSWTRLPPPSPPAETTGSWWGTTGGSPPCSALRSNFGPLHHPVVVDYTVNAGRLEPGSWYGDSELQGSRFVGEGGHFVDTVVVAGRRPDRGVCDRGRGRSRQPGVSVSATPMGR